MDLTGRNGGSSIRPDDTSLGMDNLKSRGRFFGDLSNDSFKNAYKSSTNGVDRRISDRLNMERKKALEALQNADKSADVFKKPQPHHVTANKENMRSIINNVSTTNSSMPLDHTDYVPFRRPNTINISDLVTDETINLETTSSNPSSACKEAKISFEPSEMTGRSTLYKKDLKKAKMPGMKQTKNLSVSEILASSFAPKARNLCETLYGGDTSLDLSAEVAAVADKLRDISMVSSSTVCSSFANSKSLPRTADMSLSKASLSQLSFNDIPDGTSFSFNGGAGTANESGLSHEDFAPGELMQSKLLMDEISWAQEYAAIPAKTLSEQAKEKAAISGDSESNGFDSPSASNSVIIGDPNFSVGNFFHMRSDNIWDIVRSKSPDKCRTPFALVDDEDDSNMVSTSNINSDSASTVAITPKVDNKTYTRLSSQINPDHESKDSGNSSENSYFLSVSAIDKALGNLAKQPNDLTEQLMMQAKKSRSCMNPQLSHTDNTQQGTDEVLPPRPRSGLSLGADIMLSSQNKASEIILENKENVDPEGGRSRTDLSDTMSFTESLLNSSDMKQMQRSLTTQQQRSPLSPIEVTTVRPNIRITEATVDAGEEADNDEWSPGTPQNVSRRIRRKSPRDRSPLRVNIEDSAGEDARTPVNSRSSRLYPIDDKVAKEPKSLCSTRLDGDLRNAAAECDFGISPNLSSSKTGCSSLVVRSNTHLSPRSVSEYRVESSPLSSTSSRYQFTQASSPTPNLDTTSNSERQLLTGVGVARKVVSSPVGSEASSTCSYSTMHSARSGTSGVNMRSISRCSSSSEFSHRDGKQIPLKVTTLELSWGSIKLRSDSRKSMQIKNIIDKRLVIRIEVSGPGFQIVNSQRSNTITLHSQECRSINISFCPTVRGVAIGKLSFYAPTVVPTIGQSFLDVALYGYGGNASVVPQNILIGPVGSPFITMGDICELSQPLERTVNFYNKGPLPAFAVISIDSIGLMLPRLVDAFEIYPHKVLIPPQHVVEARIVFKPKREEIKKILKKMGNVLTLANMRVICGDEANRQRVRRLLKQMDEGERAKMSSNVLDMLWTTFEGEVEMKELADIHENPSVAMDLTSGFRIHEILLTINYDNMDETAEASSLFLPEADETVLFRTVVCAADSPTPTNSLGTVNEIYEEGADAEGEERAYTNIKQASWSVKPALLEMNLNRNDGVVLIVQNGFKSRQYFEVVCNKKDLLRFTPSEGYVAPDNGQTEITVEFNTNLKEDQLREDIFIMVYMENERITVPVKFF